VCVCVFVLGVERAGAWGGLTLVDLLEAEYQLFKSAVYSARSSLSPDRLLDEFTCLQQRHAALVSSLIRSHADLQQVSQ